MEVENIKEVGEILKEWYCYVGAMLDRKRRMVRAIGTHTASARKWRDHRTADKISVRMSLAILGTM